jgi:hypothetical protein
MPATGGIRVHRMAALLACLPALAACTSLLSATTADVAGVVSTGISSGITKNAAVGTGVGLGVAAGADAGLSYVRRRVHHGEQQQIATAAGPLAPGQIARWGVVHDVPIEANEHGRVTAFRSVALPGFTCKDIVFSVDDDTGHPVAFYTTTICFDGVRWRWAEAEPATTRWGGLQ